jgi:predicted dehydrogenase
MNRKINWSIVGVGGWGRQHLAAIRKLEQSGQVRLLCVCDPTLHRFPELGREFANSKTRVYHDLTEMLSGEPELAAVTIAAPIPLHDQMIRLCLSRDNLFIYLEKPPVPLARQLDELISLDSKLRVGVAFQMVEAPWSLQLKHMLVSGKLGELRDIRMTACWPRGDQYYNRAAWAGKMTLNGEPVFDGPATNGLAHLIHNCMYFASGDSSGFAIPSEIRGEMYRARPIESYDTCCLRGNFPDGCRFFAAFTHAASMASPFHIEISGGKGWARVVENEYIIHGNFDPVNGRRHPDDTLSDAYQSFIEYIQGRRPQPPTLLRDTRGYSLATNAMRDSSGDIHTIGPDWAQPSGEGENRTYHIRDINEIITDSLRRPLLFSERKLPWAVNSKPVNLPICQS